MRRAASLWPRALAIAAGPRSAGWPRFCSAATRAAAAQRPRGLASASVAAAAPTFADLGVSAVLCRRLADRGIVAPTEVQRLALPAVLGGGDAVLQAETGTGKTLCYLLRCLDVIEERHAAAASATVDAVPQLAATGAAAVVIVPTVELVAQVLALAQALAPERAAGMRGVAGARGASRRDTGLDLIVATPRALRDNVNAAHLAGVRVLVLDEADMLLGGAYLPDVAGFVLATFKQRLPPHRPQHVFVAATLPARGRDSPAAFLDRYYPAPGVARVSTVGVHRPLPLVRTRFVQVDASLPPGPARSAAAARLRASVARVVAAVTRGGRSGGGGGGGDVDGRTVAVISGDGSDGGGGGGGGGGDAIAARMAARDAEDAAADLRAAEAAHAARVDELRGHALLEALISPPPPGAPLEASALGVAAVGSDDASASAPAAASRSSPKAAGVAGADSGGGGGGGGGGASRRHRTPSLADFVSGAGGGGAPAAPPRPPARPPGAAPPLPPPPPLPWPSAAAGAPHPGVTPLAVPTTGGLRTRVTPAEAAAVPPTLVFVRSAASAEATRRLLVAAVAAPGGGAGRSPARPPPQLLRVAALHGDLDEADRLRALASFAAGDVDVLVCTDVASRGVDTTRVAHVIQADFASDVVAHLHRAGRTARAGRAGAVTCLVTHDGLALAARIVGEGGAGRPLDAAFSRRRSLRKAEKRGVLVAAEEAAVMAALEAEEAAALGGGNAAPPLAPAPHTGGAVATTRAVDVVLR